MRSFVVLLLVSACSLCGAHRPLRLLRNTGLRTETGHAEDAERQADALQNTLRKYKRQVQALGEPVDEDAGASTLMEIESRSESTARVAVTTESRVAVAAEDTSRSGDVIPDITRTPSDGVSNPFERYGASSVVRGGKLYQFGGMAHGGAVPSNELVEFDLSTKVWNTVPTYGVKPIGRFFHSAALSPDGTQMYVSGGTPCFSRVYMKSLDFEDANGQYISQRQHATTEELSVEHAQGLDDVHEFSFITKEWTELKRASSNHLIRCKAATNVYYAQARNGVAGPASGLRVGACTLLLGALLSVLAGAR